MKRKTNDCVSFSKAVAEKYSIRRAVLLEYLAFNLHNPNCEKDDEGNPWFKHSVTQFEAKLPFIKNAKVLLNKFVKDGVLKKGRIDTHTRTNYYAFADIEVRDAACSEKDKFYFNTEVALDCPKGGETSATVYNWFKTVIACRSKKDPKFDGLEVGSKWIHHDLPFITRNTIKNAIRELVERQYLTQEAGETGSIYRLVTSPNDSEETKCGGIDVLTGGNNIPIKGQPHTEGGSDISIKIGGSDVLTILSAVPMGCSDVLEGGSDTPTKVKDVPIYINQHNPNVNNQRLNSDTSPNKEVIPPLGAASFSHFEVTSCGRPSISKPSCEPLTPSNAITPNLGSSPSPSPKLSLKHIPDYLIACGKGTTTNSSKISVSMLNLLEGYSTDVNPDSILTNMFYNVLVHDFGELENKQDFSFSYVSRYFGKFESTDHDIYDVERILPADKTLARYGNVLLSCIRQFNHHGIPFELGNPDLKALCNFLTRFPDESPENIVSVLEAVLVHRELFMKHCPPTSETGSYSISSYPGLGRDLKTLHCTTLRYFFTYYHFFLTTAAKWNQLDISCYTSINPDQYKCKNSDYLARHVQLELFNGVKKVAQHVANRLGRLAFRVEACLAFRETLLSGTEGNASSLNQCSSDVDIWGLSHEKYTQPMSIEFYIWATKVAKQLNAPLFASLAYTKPFQH